MKKIYLIFILISSLNTFSQKEISSLKTYTFSEVEKTFVQKPKPIIIFTHTDWCKICHGMQKTTFKNDEIIQLLNENFYFVKLNGEEKNNIHFLGKTFKYKPTGANTGIHELANELASVKGIISYPTTTILNTKFEISAQLIGFYNSKKLKKILEKYLKK
ncbi:DUF255 domain-containing protein [Polaribacter aestuariivivens]|uniref:DUF255 domain-containing protein n=1 Tax=Polaribacter aestuariivivens TaxID=2304626 RepID=A0A5S3N3M8_9FLAO|nr:thioredoxin fold domain-containing protein [Polaribacter aestuariivivens]TMM29931.1 DUF255 domain-containing protein [Polaribacter aestuariivivens]